MTEKSSFTEERRLLTCYQLSSRPRNLASLSSTVMRVETCCFSVWIRWSTSVLSS